MATHSSTVAWNIPWGQKESDTTELFTFHFQSKKSLDFNPVLPRSKDVIDSTLKSFTFYMNMFIEALLII